MPPNLHIIKRVYLVGFALLKPNYPGIFLERHKNQYNILYKYTMSGRNSKRDLHKYKNVTDNFKFSNIHYDNLKVSE
jgi:hypothetical protein